MDNAFDCKDRLSPELDVTLLPVESKKGETFANRNGFRKILQTIRPDCLVTYNWGAIEWAMANWPHLVRHVHVEDGFGPEEARQQLPRRALTRRLVLRSSTVVVPSRQLECIALQVWKLRRSTVQYLPNGIDCARFADTTVMPLIPRGDRPVIGTVAALRAEKNLLRLIDAFCLVNKTAPCLLVIAGDGPERTRLQTRVNELGITNDVIFAGQQRATERVYRGLDIFVLSSDTEQMPTSVIEAMAAGLPIAATDVGDVRVMLSEENLPFVVSPNPETLANAMLALLNDQRLRQKVGAANQARALRNFSQDKMFAAYGMLFDASSQPIR